MSFLDDFLNRLEQGIQNIPQEVAGAVGRVSGDISGAAQGAEHTISTTLDRLTSQASSAISGAEAQTRDAAGDIGSTMNRIVSTPVIPTPDVRTDGGLSVKNQPVSLSDIATSIPAALRDTAGAAGTGLVEAPGNIADTAANLVGDVTGQKQIGQTADKLNQQLHNTIEGKLQELGVKDQGLGTQIAKFAGSALLFGPEAKSAEGGAALADGIVKAGLGAKSLDTLNSIADLNPGLARSMMNTVINPGDMKLLDAIKNPTATDAGASLLRQGAQEVGGAAGFAASQGAIQGKKPEDIAKEIPSYVAGGLGIRAGMEVAPPLLSKVQDFIGQAQKDGVSKDVVGKLQSFADNLAAPISNEKGAAALPGGDASTAGETPAELAARLRDSNKAVNQANTAATRDAVMSGQREDQRLTDSKQLQIAKDYTDNGLPKAATPETTVPIYRAGDPNTPIAPGDHISLTEAGAQKYTQRTPGLEVSKQEVPLKDLVGSGGMKNEFVYAPRESLAAPATADQAVSAITGKTAAEVVKPDVQKELDLKTPTSSEPVATSPTGGRTPLLNMGKNLTPEVKSDVQQWIRERKTAQQIDPRIMQRNLGDHLATLDAQGLQGFHEVQSGAKTPATEAVRGHLDEKFQQLVDSGVRGFAKDRYVENYLPGMWKNSREEIATALPPKKVGGGDMTFKKVISDYQAGIDKGLTPRFDKVSDLMGYYESSVNKAIADKKFFDTMLAKGELSTKRQPGWVSVTNTKYYAPKSLADALNNYIKPNEGILAKAANIAGYGKRVVTTAGIPKTGFNAHSLNVIISSMKSAQPILHIPMTGPIKGLFEGVGLAMKPSAAEAYMTKNLDFARELGTHSMFKFPTAETFFGTQNIDTKALGEGNPLQKLFGKFESWRERTLETPLFKQVIPALQLKRAEEMTNKLVGRGIPRDQALKQAGDTVAKAFQNPDYNEMLRNKESQNLMNSLVFARSLYENLGVESKDIVKALTTDRNDPKMAPIRQMAGSILGMYVTANVINKATSGHYMWENAAGHKFGIELGGQGSGKPTYIPVFGAAGELAGATEHGIEGLFQGDIAPFSQMVRGRLSTPAALATSMLTNTDRFGRTMTSTKQSLGQNIGNVATQILSATTPPAVTAGTEYARGSATGPQALARATGVPIRPSGVTPNQQQKSSGGGSRSSSSSRSKSTARGAKTRNISRRGGSGGKIKIGTRSRGGRSVRISTSSRRRTRV